MGPKSRARSIHSIRSRSTDHHPYPLHRIRQTTHGDHQNFTRSIPSNSCSSVSQPTQSWLWYLRILKGYSSLGDPRDERDRRIPGPGGQILIRHLPLDLLHLNPSELKPRRSSRSPISDLFLRFQGRILNRFTQTDHCGLRSSSESQRSSKDFRYGRFDRSNDLRCQEISL